MTRQDDELPAVSLITRAMTEVDRLSEAESARDREVRLLRWSVIVVYAVLIGVGAWVWWVRG